MYQPPGFQIDDIAVLHELMRAHPFAVLATHSSDGLAADHIPFLLKPDAGPNGTLNGHIALANPLWKNIDDGTEVLVIFQGTNHYITPAWYPAKQEHGKVVPTWNYTMVHASGPMTFHQDADWLHTHVSDLSNQQEAGRDAPWATSDAPEDFMKRQLRGIVGIEIPITRLEGKFKLSQNRNDADQRGVREGLENEPDADAKIMSQLMQRSTGQ